MAAVGGDDVLLEKALKDLRTAWAVAGEGWQDRARDDFETTHLQELETRVRDAARALRQLSLLIAEARRQCT